MKQREISNEIYKLLFDVRRSVRYHDRRRAFFETMHRITAVLTILMAGSVLFDLGKPGITQGWLIALSVLAALLAALDMVLGYASKADLHRSLKKQFGELEIAIVTDDETEDTLKFNQNKRLEIEQNEPPIYRALDRICHNEIVTATGIDKKELCKVGWFEQLTRHFFYWSV